VRNRLQEQDFKRPNRNKTMLSAFTFVSEVCGPCGLTCAVPVPPTPQADSPRRAPQLPLTARGRLESSAGRAPRISVSLSMSDRAPVPDASQNAKHKADKARLAMTLDKEDELAPRTAHQTAPQLIETSRQLLRVEAARERIKKWVASGA
jgi:hypothetical protein